MIKVERHQFRLGIEALGIDSRCFTSLISLADGEGLGWTKIGPLHDQVVRFVTLYGDLHAVSPPLDRRDPGVHRFDVRVNVMRLRTITVDGQEYIGEFGEYGLVCLSEILGQELAFANPEPRT